MNKEHQRLLSLARSQVISDIDLADCWHCFVEALQKNWLGLGDLPELINALEGGGSRGYQEIDFDWSDDDEHTLVLTFVRDEFRCSGKRLIAELERLLRRYHGASGPGPTAPAGGQGSGADGGSGPDILGFVAGLLGTTPEALDGGDPAALGLAGAGRLDELKAQIASAMAAGQGLDTRALGQALQILADWLQGKREDTGEAVDALLEKLERAVGPLIGNAADQETMSRIRKSARESIAARLQEAGIPSSSKDT